MRKKSNKAILSPITANDINRSINLDETAPIETSENYFGVAFMIFFSNFYKLMECKSHYTLRQMETFSDTTVT